MIRCQIQLPDKLHERVKKLSEAREVSFAELARRGMEYIVNVYPERPEKPWAFPEFDLGWNGLTDDALKIQARMTTNELALAGERDE